MQQTPNLKSAGDGRTECRLIKTERGPVIHVSIDEKDSPWYMLKDEERHYLFTTFLHSPLWDMALLHISTKPREPALIAHVSSTWFIDAWDDHWITRIQIGDGQIDLDCPTPGAPCLQLNVLMDECIVEVSIFKDAITARTVIELTDEILQNLLIAFHLHEAMTSTGIAFRTVAMFRQKCFQVETVVARDVELTGVFGKVLTMIPATRNPNDMLKAVSNEAMTLLEPIISRPLDRQQIEHAAAETVQRVSAKYGKYTAKASLRENGQLVVELVQSPNQQIHRISFETTIRIPEEQSITFARTEVGSRRR